MLEKDLPKRIRVSIGSAIVLGLAKGKLGAEPTTVYLLTYRKEKCSAACTFCPQSRNSDGRADMLSRVLWPVFPTDDVICRIVQAFKEGKIERVCIQALNYPSVQQDMVSVARKVRSLSQVPISASCQPLNKDDLTDLVHAGVDRISIALDATTEELFDKSKGSSAGGPYSWNQHFEALRAAVEVFGPNSVTTHLIAGLGEKEEDIVAAIQRCVDLGILPALFAFTPVRGTVMSNSPPPPLDYYRRIQIARYLITRKMTRYEEMSFKSGRLVNFGLQKAVLRNVIRTGEPFRTSGCPACNRPYYNERPRGPTYNYPTKPSEEEISEIIKQVAV